MRAERVLSWSSVAALFALVVAFCLTRLTDTDIWWHLASGDLIRRTGAVPLAEPFSYTVPGLRFIDIHWLFQVAVSFLYERGGARALDLFKILLIAGLFVILFARARRIAGVAPATALLLLVTLACQERFLVRPEIVSFLLLAATLWLLERALAPETGSRDRRLILWAALPLIQILWVNVQGLFMLGPALAALALFASLAGARREGGIDRSVDLLAGLACGAVASLLNPYGAQALRLPFRLLFAHLGGESLLSRTIAEFQPTLSASPPTAAIAAFVILALLTVVVLFANAAQVRPFDLLVAVATGFLALRARRNIPIFAIAATPLLLRNAREAWALALRAPAGRPLRFFGTLRRIRVPRAAAPACLLAAALFMIQDVASNRFFLRTPTERWFGLGPIPHYFPEEAARFVDQAALPGQVFHPLAAGGFLIHAWRGERGVFIDGRNDPYLDGVLASYLQATADPAAFEELVRRYQITAVLWPHERVLEAKPLLAYLARGSGWSLIHLDAGGSVFARADILTPMLLLTAPPAAGQERSALYAQLEQALDRDRFAGPPIREIALGEFFNVTGDPHGAEIFYRRAIARMPAPRAPLLYNQALAIERQGRSAEARAGYERALAADHGYLPAAAALGAMFVEEGRFPEAQALLDRAYRGGERGARLMIARGRLFDRLGRPAEAVAAYQEGLRASPRNVTILREIATFYLGHDQPDAALAFLTEASEVDPDDAATALRTAEVLTRLGRRSSALDVARDAARRAGGRIGAGAVVEEDDRRLILMAARLEMRDGDARRAAEWLEMLRRAGALRAEEIEPDLRRLLDRPAGSQ